jgi:DNA-binding MarR family transcriptional regulator
LRIDSLTIMNAVSNPSSEGDELAAEWHDLLGRYHRTTCALDRALLAGHDLTVSDFEVLQQLHGTEAEDGRLRLHDLGEQVHLSQSALSRLITRLEKAGLVTRCVCEDDRRSVWTELTASGAQRYVEARPTHRAILTELAAGQDVQCEQATSGVS